jgi:hypothetical protein
VDDLALDESAPKVAKRGKAKDEVLKLRANIGGIIQQAAKQKIDVYFADFEITFPRGMTEAYPSAADLNSEFAWQFLEKRLDEVWSALPQLAGIVLYTDEPDDLIIYNQKNIDRQAAVRRLIELYLRVCRRHGGRLAVCTFADYASERYDILISALRQIPPSKDLLVDNYICPSDWGFIRLVNPAIGKTGHPEFLTANYADEVLGQAQIPICEARLLQDRILEAQRRGAKLVGINGYISWYGRKIFGTPTEINLDLAPALLSDPHQDPGTLVHQWLGKHYGGPAADALTSAFLNSFDTAEKAIQTLGFWSSEYPKSSFPDPVWLEFSIRTEDLAIFDPSYKSLGNELVHPDAKTLARVIQEKDEAVSMAAQGVKAVEQIRTSLSEPDYRLLHRQFLLAWYIARAYRLYMEAYFRFRIWDQSGRGPVPAELSMLTAQIEALAAEMEKGVDSPPVFCPKSLRSCLKVLEGFLNGKPFPDYPTSMVYAPRAQYPPSGSTECSPDTLYPFPTIAILGPLPTPKEVTCR